MNHLVEELRKGSESGVLIDCATLTAAADEIEDCHVTIKDLLKQLVSMQERLRSTEMQAVAQQAILKHPYHIGHAASAYGLAGVALKAVADALTDEKGSSK